VAWTFSHSVTGYAIWMGLGAGGGLAWTYISAGQDYLANALRGMAIMGFGRYMFSAWAKAATAASLGSKVISGLIATGKTLGYMAAGAGVNVFIDFVQGGRLNSPQDYYASAIKGAVYGLLARYLTSSLMVGHINNINTQLLRYAPGRPVASVVSGGLLSRILSRVINPVTELVTKLLGPIAATSLYGALIWTYVSPLFTAFGSLWAALPDVLRGDWSALMVQDPRTGQNVSLLSGDGLWVLGYHVITGPLTGRWMHPLISVLSAPALRGSRYQE